MSRRIFGFGLLALIAVSGLWFVVKARATGLARVYFSPAEVSMPPGTKLDLMIDSGDTGVGFAKVEFNFDNTLINLTEEIGSVSAQFNVVSKTTMAEANNTGHAVLTLGLNTEFRETPPTGQFKLAELNFSPITSQTNQLAVLAFNQEGMQVVAMDATNMNLNLENATFNINVTPTLTPSPDPTIEPSPVPTTEPTPTPTDIPTPTPTEIPLPTPTSVPTPTVTPTPNPTASLSLSSLVNPVANKEWPVDLRVNTQFEISGIDAVLKFDQTKLNVLRIEDKQLLGGTTQTNIDNTNGVVKVSQTVPPEGGYVGNGTVAAIIFRPIKSGQTTVSWEYAVGSTNESNVILKTDGTDILTQPQNLVVTVAQSKGKLKMQTASLNQTAGHATAGTFSSDDWTMNFETNAAGESAELTWDEGSSGLTLPLYVKVPGYLRKKLVTTLDDGVTLDFGKLLAGDLNNDGVVNTVDLAIIYSQWFASAAADYNKDGTVNTADYWILTQNYFKVND